ncbi:hypothetical protein F511_16290 [Dorcoceras hygrometricum]|uniref:Uncharacterized protein n=1 Tax=Dorcoceras hygrometricum TaxID=472368 RepID=A0A2Z7B9S9_9LAMI|nr:hypothetical protein F511_16290 [Dorcoceras hygrometricum]
MAQQLRNTTGHRAPSVVHPAAQQLARSGGQPFSRDARQALPCWRLGAWLRPVSRGNRHFTVGGGRLRQSGPRLEGRLLRQPALEGLTRSARTETPRKVGRNKFRRGAATQRRKSGSRTSKNPLPMLNTLISVSVHESRIPYLCDPQWFRDTASRGPTTIVAPESQFRTCPSNHGITDSACKNQLVMGSVQYGPFNPYIPIRSTTIGKSRVAKDPIAMHTSWRSNSDIASVTSIRYPRMSASGESSTTMHRLLHASGSHPIPPPNEPKTNQYNQDLGLIHSTNGNHLESPNEGSSIDHQVTIYLHAQNITMFPTNETWYFASQILVSSSGGLILILTAQSSRN